ncbi:MAG: leucine-rich repeat domain-containing protein [Christensenellaceae bacterium]
MKKRWLLLSAILSVLALMFFSTPTFAWFSEISAPNVEFKNVSTISKTVDFSVTLDGSTEGVAENAALPFDGYYPVMPKEKKDFISDWLIGTVSGVQTATKNHRQVYSASIAANASTDRIYQPVITLSGAGADSLSYAVYAGDETGDYLELSGYSDCYYDGGELSQKLNPFVVKKGKSVKVSVIIWIDSAKCNDDNVGKDAELALDLQSYLPVQHYTDGLTYTSNSIALDTGLNAFASGYTVSVGKTDKPQTLIIPSYYLIDGVAYPVTEVGAFNAGNSTQITSVKIADTVQKITNSFNGRTNVARVDLGEGVKTITDRAFYGTGVTELVLPESVTSISRYAFQANKSLTNLVVNCNADIPQQGFEHCDTLKSVTIGKNVKAIGQRAFNYCTAINEINLIGGTTIGQYAFANTKIARITIPENITAVANYAFYQCTLLTDVELLIDGKMSEHVFNGCAELKSVTVGEKVIQMYANSFKGCTKLASLTFKDTETPWLINSVVYDALSDPQQNAAKMLSNTNITWNKAV